MLILPPGHAESISSARRLTGRERRMVGAVGAVGAVLVVLALFALTGGTPKPAKGCLNVTVPSSVGGQVLAACGATAREICAQLGTPEGYQDRAATLLGAQCRQQGIKVG